MRDYEPYYTEDGSIGLYSFAEKDVFHSKYGALTEAWEKFILPSNISNIINTKESINILDVCYGIGYNTKALMSFVIDNNKNKILKKNIFQKLLVNINNIVSICNNNQKKNKRSLSLCNDTICDDNFLSFFNIDCLEINEELIKLSPLFKTIKTPGEIYSQIVPDIFNCFDTYYKIKNIFENLLSIFYPKNKKDIRDLLDLKFKNMHIEKEYKINNLVNYIILNRLYENFGKEYFSDNIKKIIKERYTSRFFSKSMIKYAKFNHFWGYNSSSEWNLSTFLHNIYYSLLSKRDKNIDFKAAERLFNMSFYVNDARKTILKLNKSYDCIFLDAFAYTKAPQLWSVEFISKLAELLQPAGLLLTYSNSAQVRNTLIEAGLHVGKIYNEKSNKFIGTVAAKDKSLIEFPLNNYEYGLCTTKAGIPYHDPNLAFSNKEILELREYEYRHSNLMSSSKYMKLRSMRSENDEEV